MAKPLRVAMMAWRFDRLRYRSDDANVYAFDLIELHSDDLRREPLEVRKATLASVLAKPSRGTRLKDHSQYDDGEIVFRHDRKMGLKRIVSKRKHSPYRSGRSSDWLKMKNSACEAVQQEAERLGQVTSVQPLASPPPLWNRWYMFTKRPAAPSITYAQWRSRRAERCQENQGYRRPAFRMGKK